MGHVVLHSAGHQAPTAVRLQNKVITQAEPPLIFAVSLRFYVCV